MFRRSSASTSGSRLTNTFLCFRAFFVFFFAYFFVCFFVHCCSCVCGSYVLLCSCFLSPAVIIQYPYEFVCVFVYFVYFRVLFVYFIVFLCFFFPQVSVRTGCPSSPTLSPMENT